MTVWLWLFGFILLALAVSIRRTERRTLARLSRGGVDRAARAVVLDRTSPLAAFVHWRLIHAGVLRPAANDRYYWDAAAYAGFRRRRRRLAVVLLVALLLIVAGMHWRGDI
jgi:hypothetical protein